MCNDRTLILRVEERRSGFYTGRAIFFQKFSGSNFIFSCLTCFTCFLGLTFFKLSSFPLLKGKQTTVSNSESVKVSKNVTCNFENGN